MSPACSRSCVSSFLFLSADSVAGRFLNWRASPCAISCTFFVASGRVDPAVRDRPLALGLALPIVARCLEGDGLGQTGNGDPIAPSRVSALLALAFEVRTTIGTSRG